MVIFGSWRISEDGVVRPTLHAHVLLPNGDWLPTTLLVDTGADRTVFSADVWRAFGSPKPEQSNSLSGVGGQVQSAIITTKLRMNRENDTPIRFEAEFAPFTDPASLDMSVLGRDILNLFAVIVDRPQDVVCLLGQKHRYEIIAS